MLTWIWAIITSIYIKTIGELIMWLTEFCKKRHEVKEAKYKAEKAKYEAINTKIITEETIIKKQIENGVNELLPRFLQWLNKEKERPGFINQTFPTKDEIKEMFLCNDDEIINECIKRLKEDDEIKKSPFGDYYFSR